MNQSNYMPDLPISSYTEFSGGVCVATVVTTTEEDRYFHILHHHLML